MRRVLISIGCDKYDYCQQLSGAEKDASSIVSALAGEELLPFNSCDVLELKSPTSGEMRSSIANLDMPIGQIDTLVFFFAGHGCVNSGSFYMCLKDTQPGKLSTTAYSLADLFLLIQEFRPRHANIVIDACESGGVIADIKSALKSSDFGNYETTGISIFAACARDQYAQEINSAGLCTTALLECINGKRYLQDYTQTLELAEIAANVSHNGLENQNPVYWGLNISSSAQFCKNPKYSHESPIRKLLTINSESNNISARVRNNLWKKYVHLNEDFDTCEYIEILREIVDSVDLSLDMKLTLLRQISNSFVLRASDTKNRFLDIEIQAASVSCLLPLCSEKLVLEYVAQECTAITNKIKVFLSYVFESLVADKYFLLGHSIHAEFFFLPVRISKLFGWIGVAIIFGNKDSEFIDLVDRFTSFILDEYSLSCSSMSDSQASFYVAGIVGLIDAGLCEHAEVYAGLMYMSLCDTNGNISSSAIIPKEIVPYLCMRANNNYSNSDRTLARPTELATAIILSGKLLGLEDTFDVSMNDLDRVSINAFIPATYKKYLESTVRDGRNYTFKIGFEIWTVDDFVDHWVDIPKMQPENIAVHHLALLCSLLYQDRVCWNLFDELLTTSKQSSTL